MQQRVKSVYREFRLNLSENFNSSVARQAPIYGILVLKRFFDDAVRFTGAVFFPKRVFNPNLKINSLPKNYKKSFFNGKIAFKKTRRIFFFIMRWEVGRYFGRTQN